MLLGPVSDLPPRVCVDGGHVLIALLRKSFSEQYLTRSINRVEPDCGVGL